MARMNLTDVRLYGQRKIKSLFTKPSRAVFTISRLRPVEITKSFNNYEDIVRVSQNIFNVAVFRNKSNIGEGIYVYGREDRVLGYIKWIKMIIVRIEMDTLLYGNPVKRFKKTHGNRAYSKYRAKKCQQVLKVTLKLLPWRNKYFDGPNVKNGIIADTILMQESIDQFSSLKNKTRYYGELRYTP
jgi:hypothetical protein